MVLPIRAQTISTNNLIANSLTHTQQFQEIFFRLKELLVAAGGTILLSNGGGSAGAADNIPNAADVTMGAAGTGAWYVIEFANLGGGAVRFLINVNDSSDPRQVINHRGGVGTWAGGNTTTLPTLTGFAYASATLNLHPFTDVRNLRWSSWRTPNASGGQSIRFVLKEDGALFPAMAFFVEGNTSAENSGAGLSRWFVYANDVAIPSASTHPLADAVITSTSNWRGVNPAGSAAVTRPLALALHQVSGNWTNGLDVDTQCPWEGILIGQSVAAGRTLGLLIDAYAIPRNIAIGAWIDVSENGNPQRRKAWGGSMALFWPTGVDIL